MSRSYKCCISDGRTYRISKKDGGDDGGHWWDQHGLVPNGDAEKEFLKEAGKKLVIHGIVEEECRNLEGGWISFFNVEKKFCHEVNKMFFGNTVNEKRLFVRAHFLSAAAKTNELIAFLRKAEEALEGSNTNYDPTKSWKKNSLLELRRSWLYMELSKKSVKNCILTASFYQASREGSVTKSTKCSLDIQSMKSDFVATKFPMPEDIWGRIHFFIKYRGLVELLINRNLVLVEFFEF